MTKLHYVDDNLIVELICLAGHSHSAFRGRAEHLGINLSGKKKQDTTLWQYS